MNHMCVSHFNMIHRYSVPGTHIKYLELFQQQKKYIEKQGKFLIYSILKSI